MVYKISVPLVGGGTRKKEFIDANNNLNVDEIRVETLSQFYEFQGSTSGYLTGGFDNATYDIIEKFPFSVDANSTDVGDLTEARYSVAGQSSITHGYTSGGFFNKTTIDKFPFSVDGNATDVGDLTVGRGYGNAAGQSSSDNGYSSGGSYPPGPIISDIIDKVPFSSDGNATDVGDLTDVRSNSAGQSSSENGYTAGGYGPVPAGFGNVDIIDKFPFSSDANATDVGDLSQARRIAAGQSSQSNGYSSGGFPSFNTIDKFPFSSDANATDVGDLSVTRSGGSGQSSTTNGYTSGGLPGYSNVIDKFPFSSDGNATDVGDILNDRYSTAGQQV